MGEAFDRAGHILGSFQADTKGEVFKVMADPSVSPDATRQTPEQLIAKWREVHMARMQSHVGDAAWNAGNGLAFRDCADELEAALRASASPSAPLEDEDEGEGDELHTGDDERIDLVSSILAAAEELRDGSSEDGDIALAGGIVDDCEKLDALLLETIKRDKAGAPRAETPPPKKEPEERSTRVDSQ